MFTGYIVRVADVLLLGGIHGIQQTPHKRLLPSPNGRVASPMHDVARHVGRYLAEVLVRAHAVRISIAPHCCGECSLARAVSRRSRYEEKETVRRRGYLFVTETEYSLTT